ncbi:hypothetical protein [Streptomyces finlayi]|uniref:hypothetical protein n=1 Tax=Streptomyces finlayi TaxID=67296 RepID=UPI0035BC2B2C
MSRGERGLIATPVSQLDRTRFCSDTHGAAAFSTFNRYVSCLDTELPTEPGYHEEAAELIVKRVYGAAR